ncbi:protein of unknown function [Azospirillum baldaniorum]|uniref:Uncharacterized protein n=1 Tax=Azospirillum baldaniorum TaxID=1064539 RepID=A0A9P1JNR9_9PROT|nr:protein of unknown function [Azospirillum baldaniorum]
MRGNSTLCIDMRRYIMYRSLEALVRARRPMPV